MSRSWIGIVGNTGLTRFELEPEQSHTLRFMQKQAVRENSLCFWAVIDDRHARIVVRLLASGENAFALQLLNQCAIDGGTIVPSIDDETLLLTARDIS